MICKVYVTCVRQLIYRNPWCKSSCLISVSHDDVDIRSSLVKETTNTFQETAFHGTTICQIIPMLYT